MRIWALRERTCVHVLEQHTRWINGFAISLASDPSRHIIVSSSADATLKVWRLHDGELLGTLEGHQRPITSFQLSGTRVLSASMDRTVRCWELLPLLCAADRPQAAQGQAAAQGAVANDHLAAHSAAATSTRVCAAACGHQLFAICAHDDFVRSVRFNHRKIVSCGDDGKVNIFSLADSSGSVGGKLRWELTE